MQLLIHVTNQEQTLNPIMRGLVQKGLNGGTVIDCKGMIQSLHEDSVDAPSIFGGLRKIANPDHENNKILMVALPDEKVQDAIDTIHDVAGDLKLPNTGVYFCLPITRWEGISK